MLKPKQRFKYPSKEIKPVRFKTVVQTHISLLIQFSDTVNLKYSEMFADTKSYYSNQGKRGLMSGLGSFWKFISGILDACDGNAISLTQFQYLIIKHDSIIFQLHQRNMLRRTMIHSCIHHFRIWTTLGHLIDSNWYTQMYIHIQQAATRFTKLSFSNSAIPFQRLFRFHLHNNQHQLNNHT